jgi:hypothetical protein
MHWRKFITSMKIFLRKVNITFFLVDCSQDNQLNKRGSAMWTCHCLHVHKCQNICPPSSSSSAIANAEILHVAAAVPIGATFILSQLPPTRRFHVSLSGYRLIIVITGRPAGAGALAFELLLFGKLLLSLFLPSKLFEGGSERVSEWTSQRVCVRLWRRRRFCAIKRITISINNPLRWLHRSHELAAPPPAATDRARTARCDLSLWQNDMTRLAKPRWLVTIYTQQTVQSARETASF